MADRESDIYRLVCCLPGRSSVFHVLGYAISAVLGGSPVGSANVAAFGDDEFVDYHGKDCTASIVALGKRRCFAKRLGSQSEVGKSVLAWNLARGHMNVPAISGATGRLHEALDRRFGGEAGAAWLLVTLCQDYRLRNLPIRDLTEAIASELAFSIWINRRDAHNSNRVYRDGIPMFFDFDAAFAPDVGETLFLRAGPDPGYTDNWRLLPLVVGHAVDTVTIRRRERNHPLTLHPVQDVERFHGHFKRYVAEMRAVPERDIVECVNKSFEGALDRDSTIEFLLSEQRLLHDKLAGVLEILSRPLSAPALGENSGHM